MAIGEGKYDAMCQATVELFEAELCFMLIVNGTWGSGVSCKVKVPKSDPARAAVLTRHVATQLRRIADEMEKDANNLNFG